MTGNIRVDTTRIFYVEKEKIIESGVDFCGTLWYKYILKAYCYLLASIGMISQRKVLTVMIYDLQKASILKRISAYVLDLILLVVLITAVALVLSSILGFNGWYQTVLDGYDKYESQFGISLSIDENEYNALPEAEKAVYDAAFAAISADAQLARARSMLINLALLIISFSILLAYLGLEFGVPLLFGNGQTMGKRVFGIAVMKRSGVKVNAISLFIRTVLGKFAIETMIPVLMILMMFVGTVGILGPMLVIGIWLVQLAMLITSNTNSLIHDALAQTVTVDMASQMIFGSESELLEYKKRCHEEMVRNQSYR